MFQIIDGNYGVLENIYYNQTYTNSENIDFGLADPSHMTDTPLSSFVEMTFWLKEEK